MTLKEYLKKEKKEKVYGFYQKIGNKIKEYDKVSRNDIYNSIISLYKEDPEVILNLCTLEEIQTLKSIIEGKQIGVNNGYIEYTILKNLLENYLILKEEKYDIPKDILNYVKMAINILDEKSYALKDVTDSVLIGLIRIHNAIKLNDFANLLSNYYVNITKDNLKSYIRNNIKLKNYLAIIKYKKEEYIISLENCFYKDVIALKKKHFRYKNYTLEEVISIGKYKLNLFKEEIFNYLSFLEVHLEPQYIDIILNELIIYTGFDLEDDKTLRNITDNIEELYKETKKVISYFPIWIYNGNTLNSLKDNFILPDKNELCFCGSGKKFKHCCLKKFK